MVLPMSRTISSRRATRLFSYLDGSISAVLIVNGRYPFLDSNFRYLTNVQGGLFEDDALIVTENGATIVTSLLEEGIAKKSGCNVVTFKKMKEYEAVLKKAIGRKRLIGINSSGLTYAKIKSLRKILKGVKFKDISKQLNKARMIKDEDELLKIKRAATIASKAAKDIPEMAKIGMTENELAAEIDYLMRCYGADGPAFGTIVAFGAGTALPHYQAGAKKLKKGSTILCDFGASYKNYCSDITRTFLTKPVDPKIEKIYGIVLEAQSAAIDKIRIGKKARFVDAAARKVIIDSGYEKYLIHSTGHGLGIDVHDPGSISIRSKDTLQENMVFTVEPGIYLPGRGGVRIEDDIVVEVDSARLLTSAPRNIITI